MKNIKKSTLLLAVIAIAALIFGGVELGNVNSLKDKIANIGETLCMCWTRARAVQRAP